MTDSNNPMSQRERLIEAALPAYAEKTASGWFWPDDWDAEDTSFAITVVGAVIDALMPQVTTVEELEALHPDAVVMRDNGYCCRPAVAKDLLFVDNGPLTVVYRP